MPPEVGVIVAQPQTLREQRWNFFKDLRHQVSEVRPQTGGVILKAIR